VNKVFLLGRLGKDPEIKETKHKSKMAKFSIATTDFGKGEDGKKVERTSWHNIIAFNRQAETCAQFLSKGSQVFIEGKLVHRSWEADDGSKRYATEIHAMVVTFCGEKRQKTEEQKPAQFTSEDIPF
jgi:single-strand DNA-binding protein